MTTSPSTPSTTKPSIAALPAAGRLITFDTELRLVCAPSLCDHFAEATVSQNFKNREGKPLTFSR